MQLTKYILSFLIFFATPLFAQTTLTHNHPVFYTDEGQGAPLVLIHAFPFDHQLWEPQQQKLTRYFRVITLDLWGFGYSGSKTRDGAAVSMADYADEVKQVLDGLNIKKAIIGGESMGGYVSLAFLKKYPDKVAGLILSDTQSIPDTTEQQNKREAAALDVLLHGTDGFIQGFLPRALSAHATLENRLFARKLMAAQEAIAIASALRGMGLREDTSEVLAQTDIPVLILSGDQDVVISPQQSANMHALAKNSRYTEIKDAGHLSNLEQPSQWNQAVIKMFYQH